MAERYDDLLDQIGVVRQRTIALYHEMAILTDAAALGWVVREPGAPDLTLNLIRAALKDHESEAKILLQQITMQDQQITDLVREILGG